MSRPRFLGVLLCYNDGDILEDAIHHLLNNRHDVVVWNHGSTDETSEVLRRVRHDLLEVTDISRDVDFYDLYPLMSKHLLADYASRYDWISWPDQDEILEGPSRARPYSDYLDEAVGSRHGWIEFNDFVYWFTQRDDATVSSPCERVRHYSLARHGPPKIRSWRASATNIRWFNHNKAEGSRYPATFNLRHYPMRSAAQMKRRIAVDRAGLQQGPVNFHYENMKSILPAIDVKGEDLHFDDGLGELDPTMKFNWTDIYGSGPKLPPEVIESYLLPTKRWEIASTLKAALGNLPVAAVSQYGHERIGRWVQALDDKITCPILIAIKRDEVKIVTEELARDWTANARGTDAIQASHAKSASATLGTLPVSVWADSVVRSVRVVARQTESGSPAEGSPLVALVPCYRGDVTRIAPLDQGAVEFSELRGTYYYLICEPVRGEASRHADAAKSEPAHVHASGR